MANIGKNLQKNIHAAEERAKESAEKRIEELEKRVKKLEDDQGRHQLGFAEKD